MLVSNSAKMVQFAGDESGGQDIEGGADSSWRLDSSVLDAHIRRLNSTAEDPRIAQLSLCANDERELAYQSAFARGYRVLTAGGSAYFLRFWTSSSTLAQAVPTLIALSKYTWPCDSFPQVEFIERAISVGGSAIPASLIEWVEGEEIGYWLKLNAHDSRLIVEVAEEFRDRMVRLNASGISHGDLRASNILVDSARPVGCRIKLIDFDTVRVRGVVEDARNIGGNDETVYWRQKYSNNIIESDYLDQALIYLRLTGIVDMDWRIDGVASDFLWSWSLEDEGQERLQEILRQGVGVSRRVAKAVLDLLEGQGEWAMIASSLKGPRGPFSVQEAVERLRIDLGGDGRCKSSFGIRAGELISAEVLDSGADWSSSPVAEGLEYSSSRRLLLTGVVWAILSVMAVIIATIIWGLP